MSNVIETLERSQLRKDVPRFKAGDTVRVHFRVIEGQRSRVQVFEGVVIKRQGAGVRETFTVRKQSFGVGVERTFPLHSPKVEKIDVVSIGDVNRAKLYYLRKKVGKKARVRELQQRDRVSSARAAEAVEEGSEGQVEPDEEFPAYFAAVDCLVNLRYPSAGETSGTLIRALEAGKPVAVSDYAQFAELPDDCVVKIPFEGEVEALAEFFAGELPDMSAAQRRWLEENATTDLAAEGYVRALSGGEALMPVHPVTASIPLFPKVQATRHGDQITLRNTGDLTLKARTYGEPAYRLIAKWDGGDKWLELPKDLAPGEEVTIKAPHKGPLRLYHALESIPMLDPEPLDAL